MRNVFAESHTEHRLGLSDDNMTKHFCNTRRSARGHQQANARSEKIGSRSRNIVVYVNNFCLHWGLVLTFISRSHGQEAQSHCAQNHHQLQWCKSQMWYYTQCDAIIPRLNVIIFWLKNLKTAVMVATDLWKHRFSRYRWSNWESVHWECTNRCISCIIVSSFGLHDLRLQVKCSFFVY